jgi:hypothetical protein
MQHDSLTPAPADAVPALKVVNDSTPESRDAIVYFAGLGEEASPEHVEAVAHRIARALDHTDPDRAARFTVEAEAAERLGGGKVHGASILRHQGKRTTRVLDVRQFDYRTALVGHIEQESPLRHLVRSLIVLAMNWVNLLAAVTRRGQSIPQKLQVASAIFLMSIVVAYAGLMLATVVAGSGPQPERQASPPGERTASTPPALEPAVPDAPAAAARVSTLQEPVKASGQHLAARSDAAVADGRWAARGMARGSALLAAAWSAIQSYSSLLQSGIISLTLLGFAVRFNLKQAVTRLAIHLIGAHNYLAFGERRNRVVGEVATLLDRMQSEEGVRYDRIHFIGYSFGSVVAIDSLFQDSEVSEVFRRVSTLATIGCPADFIRTYWRDYFVRRHEPPNADLRWINVYASADVLASNFVQGGFMGTGAMESEATSSGTEQNGHGVQLREGQRLPCEHVQFGPQAPHGIFGWTGFILTGGGFRAHTRYWDAGSDADKTCFEPLVRRIAVPRGA